MKPGFQAWAFGSWHKSESLFGELSLSDAQRPTIRFELLRARIVDRLFDFAGVFAGCAIPVVAWSVYESGWHFEPTCHALLIAGMLALMPWRRRLGSAVKSALLLTSCFALGVSGVLTYGMYGTGYWWCVQPIVLGALLYSFRTGLALALLVGLVMASIAFGFVSGALELSVDLNARLHSARAWTAFLYVIALAPTAVLLAFGRYQDTIKQLVAQIDAQRAELSAQVGHDPLTGLPQAALAADRLQAAMYRADRSGTLVALLFIDLDGFKQVNDVLGHAAGDFVLQQVASQLHAEVRDGDTVARIGGDEFIVILADLPDAAAAGRVAAQIVARVAAISSWQGRALRLGASVGVALYPEHGADEKTLRHGADAAMYQVKRSGRNGWRLAERPVLAG